MTERREMSKTVEIKKTGRTTPLLRPFLGDYVAAEQNLETIGFFSARYSRLRSEESSKVVELSDNRRIEIIPATKYGLPNAEDLDFYRGFLKVCDERASYVKVVDEDRVLYHPQLPIPIAFSTRELIAKSGRRRSGREVVAVRTWIERMASTTVHGELFNARTRRYDVRLGVEPVFRRYVHVGQPISGDEELASQNYVWLADWFIDNYYYLYSRRLDLKFHHRLSHAIAKTLYPILDNGWFAANGNYFTKRYSDLCTLLGIRAHQQFSRVRTQLDPSHDELVNEQFLAAFDYPLDEDGQWTGAVRWWPGPKWIQDQQVRGQKRLTPQGAPSVFFSFNADTLSKTEMQSSKQIALPLAPAVKPLANVSLYHDYVVRFYERMGQGSPSRDKLHSGVALVQKLMEDERYAIEDLEAALDWVSRNLQTRFRGQVQSIGILPHVMGEALQYRNVQEQQRATTQRRLEAQAEQERWEHERKQWEKVLAALPEAEWEALRHEAVQSLLEQGLQKQFLVDSLIRLEMIQCYKQRMPPETQGRVEALFPVHRKRARS